LVCRLDTSGIRAQERTSGIWCYYWSTAGTHCPIGYVMLGLFISQNNLDDLPIYDIVRYLCPTGITIWCLGL